MTWPRPTLAELEQLYGGDDYYSSRAMGEGARAAWSLRAREILAAIPGQPRRVLDIGAGAGHFVAAVRGFGLSADGIEPAGNGRLEAKRLYGVDLFPELPLGSASYDLITLIHSLEHMPDPMARLRSIRGLLTPVGGTVFIEVPHAGSVEMWTSRRVEILDLPAHLFHFVPETLTRLVAAAGLHVRRILLTNPDFVESALNLWARSRPMCLSPQPMPSPPPVDPRVPNSLGFVGATKAQLIGGVRHLFPGWKFVLVATVPR